MIHAPLATLFSAAFCGLAIGQVPAKPEPVIAPEHAGMRIELTRPEHPVHVWAASEWTLAFHNGSTTGLPFDADLLTPRRCDDAGVHFEISKDDGSKSVISNNGDGTPFCGERKLDLLQPGSHAELPVVLHGDMVYDPSARARGEPSRRFVPVFAATGAHTVTAVLTWGGSTIRSAPIVVDVRAVPPSSADAQKEMERLAATGLGLDVQWTERFSKRLEEISAFVETYPYTLYGAQLRFGLASTVYWHTEGRLYDEWSITEVKHNLLRAGSLLAHEPPGDFGLQRSWERLRKDVAAAHVVLQAIR